MDQTAILKTILAQTIVAANIASDAVQQTEEVLAGLATKANIASPAFTGIPTAPTPSDMTDSAQIATTEYLDRLRGAAGGIATLDNTGKIPSDQIPPTTVSAVFTAASQPDMLALAASPGNFCIRTDLSNATFILQQLPASTLANWYEIGFSPVLSVAGLTGAISATSLTAQLLAFIGDSGSGGARGEVPAPGTGDGLHKFLKASGGWTFPAVADLSDTKTGSGNLVLAASPTLTGTPVAPTATIDTNSGQIASTAFVLGQLSQAGDGTPQMDGTAARGLSTHGARADHVHPIDTSRAPLDSPAFTGMPTAPTQTAGDNSTKLATTAYADTGLATKAPLASPAFTGVPTAPTAAPGTNNGQIATTGFVQGAISGISSGQPIPTSSAYPVGMVAILYNNSSAITDEALVGGSVLLGFSLTPTGVVTGTPQSGTWKNISGVLVDSSAIGTFVRVT